MNFNTRLENDIVCMMSLCLKTTKQRTQCVLNFIFELWTTTKWYVYNVKWCCDIRAKRINETRKHHWREGNTRNLVV